MPIDPRRLASATVTVESLARMAQARQEADRDRHYEEPPFECAACGVLLDGDVDLCDRCIRENDPPRSGFRA